MTGEAPLLAIPGYRWFEQRRMAGMRGGIAMLVRKGLVVELVVGNEYA